LENWLTIRIRATVAGSVDPSGMIVLAQEVAELGEFGIGVFVQRPFKVV
jgi:hypothetical protein